MDEHLADWLSLPAAEAEMTLRVGDVTLAFESSDAPSVRASLTFNSDGGEPLRVPLQAGVIELV